MAKLSSTQIYGDLKVDGEIKNKATTTTEGVVQLNDAVNSTSTTQGATANAVKKVNDTVASHVSNTTSHITASERTTWNSKASTATATSSSNGLMSSTDKAKLDGATNSNTASKIVARDANGNFSAGTITASLSGNASTATKLATARTITLNGQIQGSATFDGSGNITIKTSEGNDTQATGSVSHAEGECTTASNWGSHAQGINTVASGEFSHAGGSDSVASGHMSTAMGVSTIAQGYAQTVIGMYNTAESGEEYKRSNYAFIIGNGTSDTNRSNAMEVGWDGILYASKDVKVNGNSVYHTGNKPTPADIGASKALTSANGYYGMTHNDGTTSNWIRTTINGILPYQSGGASSLGTSAWQFNNIYGKNIYANGVNIGTEIANLKSLASQSVIKSIQRGLATKGRDITVTISAVNTSKAFVLGGSTDRTGSEYNYNSRALLLNSTTIKFNGDSMTEQPWQVIEFY